ncbi:MAG TPA: tripartite tricarboxylate transporter substrate binding protein [Xanthobacteraceae bacterium]
MRVFVPMLVAAALLGAPVPEAVLAQDFPAKPVTIVNPLSAGAGVDVITRLYAEAASRTIGQRVLVENRTGSGGIVGAMAVKEARPDGHTLFLAHVGTHATLQAMQPLPYDPVRDFEPVTQLFYFPTFLVVPAASPARTAADVIALAKSRPGGVRLASQGVGSGTHILGAIWADLAKAPIEHVPYRGSGQLMPDLLAGRVDLSFISYLTIRALVQEGKLRILAVASTARWRGLPEVPTMAEAGFPGVDQDTWFGLAAPAGTPAPVIAKLFAEFVKASADPALNKRAADDGIHIAVSKSPQEFGALWASETQRWGKVVKALGIKAE